jgi:hypothetical protein
MTKETPTYHAQCFCGAVEFKLTGSPALMAYCHCDDCRQWSAGPVSEFTLWKPETLIITKGEEHLSSYDRNSAQHNGEVLSERTWCSCCGGHLFTRHPTMGLIDVPKVLIKGLAFQPAFHVHYQRTVLPIIDGLPKFKDLPEPAGGSGETIDEAA